MWEIHLGPCPAHSKCPDIATYCEIFMWSLETPQHQVGATIEALSTCITQYQLVSTLGWFLHWEMDRSDRTCQKVEPGDGNGSLVFSAINLVELRYQKTTKIKSTFISSVQLAIVENTKIPNELVVLWFKL